jgi:hypothetical protein
VDRGACQSASDRGAAQKDEIAVRQDRQVHPTVGERTVPAQVAADALAAQAAGRWYAILCCHREVAHDCRLGAVHDFRSAAALPEHPVWLARRAVRALLRPGLPPRVATPKAVYPLVPRVAPAQLAEWV